jgi:hypothetical protein
MSPSVSQIGFWKEPSPPPAALPNAGEGGQGAAYLSYNMLLALSVLGGFLALDHLYLRSPLTFLAKLVLNIFTLGAWWLYDASQVVFNRDVVKIFGLSLPGWGPMGIGAGSLAGDVPDKKHMAFFAYGLALIFGGIFGLDSFLVGDKQSGFIRLISLITVVFAPIAMFWWGLNLVKFFAKTKGVVEENWEYFGAPQPASEKAPLVAQFISRIPIVNKLFGSTLAGVFGERVADIAEKTITRAAEPALGTLEAAVGVAQEAVGTVKSAVDLGATTVDSASKIARNTLNTVGKVAETGTAALGLGRRAATLSEGVTEQALKAALENNDPRNPQIGGAAANNDMLSYTLIGTFALLAVSGLVLTYRRLRQNEQPRKDDSPPTPEPGVLRKSNQEKPAQAP